jgi:ABC-type transport system involved in multi-copper enzyme maturation permease subunit
MLLGPVFHFELVRIARRWRLYAVRFGFGMILLLLIGFNYLSFFDPDRPWDLLMAHQVSISRLAQFGTSLVVTILLAQAALVLALTPGLVADSIAGERQRKTLHYLMASRLRSGEIVAGKLAARLLHLAVFVAVTLPILSLLTLFGGVDPRDLGMAFLATATTTYWLAGLAILASAVTRNARDALLASYALAVLFLVGPLVVEGLIAGLSGVPEFAPWGFVFDALHTLNGWFLAVNPLSLLGNVWSLQRAGSGAMLEPLAWMIGLQAAYGTACVILTTLILRPMYRWIEGQSGVRRKGRWRWRRLLPRPAVGNWPVYWKEAHVSGTTAGTLRTLIRFGLILLVTGIMVAVLSEAPGAFHELLSEGVFASDYRSVRERSEFNMVLRVGGSAIFGLWLVALGLTTAGGIATEREQDTWISLLATPLEGREILRDKMLGPLRAVAPLGAPVLVLWTLGLLSGAIHPFGFLLGLAALGLFTWFVVAMGTYASLISQTAWRAQGFVLAVLVAPNFCCFIPSPLWLTGLSLISYGEFVNLLSNDPIDVFQEAGWNLIPVLMILGYFVGGPLIYLMAAVLLTRASFDQFDRIAQRPFAPAPFLDAADVFVARPPAKPGDLDD